MKEFALQTNGLEEKCFAKGDVILEEGKTNPEVLVLKSGTVKVSTADKEICKINQPNTILGEIAILLDMAHTATVIADENCTFYVVSNFMDEAEKDPKLALHVAQGLANRLVNMNTNFVEIRNELEQIRDDLPTGADEGGLHRIIIKMDQFWGKTVF